MTNKRKIQILKKALKNLDNEGWGICSAIATQLTSKEYHIWELATSSEEFLSNFSISKPKSVFTEGCWGYWYNTQAPRKRLVRKAIERLSK